MNSKIKSEYIFLSVVVLFGLIMRLNWAVDMEWKDDEKIMYNLAHEIAATGKLPVTGMMSGGGIVNPGLSVGVFAFIATFTNDPVSMARAVQHINVIAILLFLLFIVIKVPAEEKRIWFWGIALACVSPLAVLFSRKIWAQDLLPLFCFLLILGNAYRKQKWGAFLWGLASVIIGQVHMSGFFLAAGIAIFSLLYDLYNKERIRWLFFIPGCLAGGIGLLPWLSYILSHSQPSYLSIKNVFAFSFYRFWMLDIHGLNIIYSLGDNFWEFIGEPFIGDKATYLIGVLHLFLAISGLLTVIWILKYLKRMIIIIQSKKLFSWLFKNVGMARFYLSGILIGLGILLTGSGTEIYPHYLICAFPFSYVFLAKVHFNRKKLLCVIIITQMIITFSFLLYIHQQGGALRGDYKRTYQNQLQYQISN